ncbi:MAG: hypothetical protein BLM47_13630 [Candidatus Reconcilbacillus cellulovorans]|uniref:Uncharacterized protein n=1 Tax=Candidatus Reconcilbacillus cellulovorans TaxID=1906605 RepID=A0A2A6DWT2_9BACL|nr:MAG: hypothetical protein BLM47_13630 [Candidatus Reconcilbacillus cellulovorans]
MKLKSVFLILGFIFLLVGTYTSSFAAQLGTKGGNDTFEKPKLLNKSDVIRIAQIHVQNYLKNDIQTMNKRIIPSSDFIELYDLGENLFAYMVPLTESNKEIGYITIGALENGYDSYDILIKDNIVKRQK